VALAVLVAAVGALGAAGDRPRRASEVLTLDVEELDLRNRCAKMRRKGNAVDVIVWQTVTARLLPACSRAAGPARCCWPP
jgi:hypothetical protein